MDMVLTGALFAPVIRHAWPTSGRRADGSDDLVADVAGVDGDIFQLQDGLTRRIVSRCRCV